MKFKFQSMLTAVAVCAVALAWGLDHLRLQKAINQLNAENAQLIKRIIPSSGFAFPSGLATDTVLVNSNPEDRREVLRLLDQSITLGEKK
jgi:hypothetical protein